MRSSRGRNARPKLDSQGLFEFAVKSLSRRAQSAAELKSKLHLRAGEAGDVERVLERLKEIGYLNDRAFAESFARSRLDNQGVGRARTLNDLRARRVNPALAATAVDSAYGETDESRLIEDYIRRKFRARPRETLFKEDKDLAAAYRRLMRAGFRSSAILPVLKKFAKNPELLDLIEEPEAEG